MMPWTMYNRGEDLKKEKPRLQAQVSSLRALFTNAETPISQRVNAKDMGKVESRNVLLEDVNFKLSKALHHVEEIDRALQKKMEG